MNDWMKSRLAKLPSKSRIRLAKALHKDSDLEYINNGNRYPLIKPKQPKNYDIWFHLLLNIYDCNNLDNHSIIKSFFKDLIDQLEMKPLSEFHIISIDGKQGRGTSAVQLITTSTITYHSDDKYYCAFIDVFSCKSYDPKLVITLARKYFTPKHVKTEFIYRNENE